MDCPFELNRKTNKWTCPLCGLVYPHEREKRPRVNCSSGKKEIISQGPGSELEKLIKRWFRQDATESCPCRSMIVQMNTWGPDGCREHIDEIIDVMMGEAEKRGMLKSRIFGLKRAKRIGAKPVAGWMVKRAIRRAEKIAPPSTHGR
jgi:hypothetical protein